MPTIDFTSGDDTYDAVADVLVGTVLNFFGGNDTLHALEGYVVADMGGGNDFAEFQSGTMGGVNGRDGNDHLIVRAGSNVDVVGGSGDDLIDFFGGSFVEPDGGSGNDTINVYGAVAIEVIGGSGNDTVNFYDGVNVRVTCGAGNDTVNIYGNMGRDIDIPRSFPALNGGDGDDVIDGNGHITGFVFGGSGNDRFYDLSTVVGGLGNDVYRSANPFESRDEGIDTVQLAFGASYTLPENVENLVVVNFADDGGAAALRGNGLANKIVGGDQAETLYGMAGDDRLSGGGADDIIIGNVGSDRIEGGAGWDRMYGGSDGDNFVFRDGDFAGLTRSTCDAIRDFSRAEGDHVRLDAVDADSMSAGNQSFTFIGTGGFTSVAGQLRFEQVNGSTYLQGDVNGDGAADFLIRLEGLHNLVAADLAL